MHKAIIPWCLAVNYRRRSILYLEQFTFVLYLVSLFWRSFRKGVVVNLEKTVRSIENALDHAEQMAGVKVDQVYVGIAGDHIRSYNGRGVVAVAGPDNEITEDDVRRAIDAAKAVVMPIDREIIHIIPQEFIVVDQRGIKDPLGMSGVRLETEVHIVTGAIPSAQNICRSVERAGVDVKDLVLEPLASSYSVLSEDEKELGVVVMDMGGGTTDIAMFFEGCIRHTAVVALGGGNVTNDIALCIRTPLDQAEAVKGKPSVLIAKTVKGKGVSFMENVAGFNGVAASSEQAEQAYKELEEAIARI